MIKWIFGAVVVTACIATVLLIGRRTPAERPVDEVPAERVEILDHVGMTAGLTYAVDVDGTRAVFGRGSELVVVDVSQPSDPQEIRSVGMSGEVRGLALGGRLAFVAADSAGLQIVDLDRGQITGSLRFKDRAHGIDYRDSTAYVAARSQGLRVVDVSDPSAPAEIGHLVTADEAVDVSLQGNHAFLAAWYESLRVIDVTDPSHPIDVSFAPFDSYDHGAVWNVAVDGDLALAVVPEKGLRTVNVSDPRGVSNYAMYRGLRAPVDAALVGRTAFITDQDAGLRVLDLTDPAAPKEIGSLPIPGRPLGIRVANSTAFIAAKSGGLRLVDVTVPNRPREVGFVDTGDHVVDVVSEGASLLVAGEENGVYHYRNGALDRFVEGRVRRITIAGSRMVVAGSEGIGLYEEDRLVAEVPGDAHAASMHDDILASAGPLGIHFFEAGGPGRPTHTGTYAAEWDDQVGALQRTPPAAWDVLLDGNRAFAAFDNGLHMIGMTGAPSASAHVRTPERIYRLALSGATLYAACDDGLRMFDVSGDAPTETAYVKTPSFATALLVDGDTVYVGDLSGHVTAVTSGKPSGTWHVADQVRGLARTDDGIAVAAGPQGLLVVALK